MKPSSMPSSSIVPSVMPTFLTDFERCRKYLAETDIIEPIDQLSASEYATFISLYSEQRVDVEKFFDLPSDLKAQFRLFSEWDANGVLHIPIRCSDTEGELRLEGICSSILDVVHQLFPPTISPSAEPSVSPSELPSSKPSSMPTALPSSLPTSEPTSSPSLEPTAMPSWMPTFLTDFDMCRKFLAEADTILPHGQVNANEYA
eukprot:14971242-Ditylum_brightwellii.AAC.1